MHVVRCTYVSQIYCFEHDITISYCVSYDIFNDIDYLLFEYFTLNIYLIHNTKRENSNQNKIKDNVNYN